MFWCGDFNYRIDLSMDDVKEGIMQENYGLLQVEDQLTKSRNSNKVLSLMLMELSPMVSDVELFLMCQRECK